MRGTSHQQIESLVVLSSENLVPQEHPIRRIKPLADRVLQELSPTFSGMYAKGGGPSVPPEHLLEASLLIALYSVRSERQFCERLTYDMLFRWFLDLNIRGGSFDQSTFAKNRTRLLAHEVTGRFFVAVVSEARRQRLLSEEHFSVDGTLLEAWAGLRHGTHQPALRRIVRGLRLGTAHRRAAGPAHPSRPHPGDERRELPAQVQPGERPAPSSRRSRRRINRTLDAFSSCSCNVAALPDLLPSVTSQRVHFCSALLAPHPGALDTSARIRGLSARGRAFSALGGQEAKRS